MAQGDCVIFYLSKESIILFWIMTITTSLFALLDVIIIEHKYESALKYIEKIKV